MAHSPQTRDAVELLGRVIAVERRLQKRTGADLAERAGISRDTLYRAERGDPSVAVGTMIELLALLRVRLFDTDPVGVARLSTQEGRVLDLLPRRVRDQTKDVDDDF